MIWFARPARRLLRLGGLVLAAALAPTHGQASNAPNLLAGVIDFHCHTAPDVVARSISDLELARMARDAGLCSKIIKP